MSEDTPWGRMDFEAYSHGKSNFCLGGTSFVRAKHEFCRKNSRKISSGVQNMALKNGADCR
jgi:hypothetical protein